MRRRTGCSTRRWLGRLAVLVPRPLWKDHVPVLMVDGYRYVAPVATHPAQQRRGYAEAAMPHALDVPAQTHGRVQRPTFLHATNAGRPVCERMGYAPVSTHTVFMEKRFLTGH